MSEGSCRDRGCLCCGGSLLRHIRRSGLCWYCQSCRQIVPCAQEVARCQRSFVLEINEN